MATILICDRSGDAHLVAVQWGLQALGHTALTWDTSRFPSRETLSFSIDHGSSHHIVGGPTTLDLDSVDTVWSRRLPRPVLSKDVDPEDLEFASTQSLLHLDSVLTTMAPAAFWVNPAAATRRDLHKPVQLGLARSVGLTIPPTLISNDPDAIRAFFAAHSEVVYKPYAGGVWTSPDKPAAAKVNYTTVVSTDDLINGVALSICPGIFQKRVPTAFEVRVTVMGRSVFSIRIEPETEDGVDWRRNARLAPLTAIDLPDSVTSAIHDFMDGAGLVFACFDFIVDHAGEHHFLEVNQAGQFLWIEERLPELPLLDAMCKFLASGDPLYRYSDQKPDVRMADAPTRPPHVHIGSAS